MKRCIDCKFSRYIYVYDNHRCERLHTFATVPDPVRGGTKEINTTPLSSYRNCEDERGSILPWRCGSKGRHFKPEDSK
ncbi:hypothetical protein [Dyella silvatica]|uniref:hypothetical protein n=1 Tax=Dyella silvatica TaxID=2992128 RepID=UPI002255269B|nr:hypothetical protein [Dyella silvatica]